VALLPHTTVERFGTVGDRYDTGGAYTTFEALVGVDGNATGTLTFAVKGDGATLWESRVVHTGRPAVAGPASLLDVHDHAGRRRPIAGRHDALQAQPFLERGG